MDDYPENITQHVRDPKVWKESGKYYMVLGARARAWDAAGRRSDKGGILIYDSDNREKWSLYREIVPEQKFGYMWECPDIFSLDERRILSFCPQGLPSEPEKYQNLYQSGYSVLPSPDLCNEYSSRQNNGTAECAWNPEETFQEWDMGFDFYAPQSFEDEEGRRILIGWAGVPDTEKAHRNLSVENGWQHCLTIPAELTCHDGKIYRRPVRELENLNWKSAVPENGRYRWVDKTLKAVFSQIRGEKRQICIGTEKNHLKVTVQGDQVELSFLDEKGTPAACGGGRGKRTGRVENKIEDLLILIDSSIIEIFVNQGELVFTTRIYLEKEEREIRAGKWENAFLEVVEE